MDNRENEPYPKSESPRSTHAEWPIRSELDGVLIGGHPVSLVVLAEVTTGEHRVACRS